MKSSVKNDKNIADSVLDNWDGVGDLLKSL